MKFVLPFIAATMIATPTAANACSYPADLFDREKRNSLMVVGTFELVNVEAKILDFRNSDPKDSEFELFEGKRHWSDVYNGVVTASDGKKSSVTFEVGIAFPDCTPFSLPQADAYGRFYLGGALLGTDKKLLVHWDGKSGKLNTPE